MQSDIRGFNSATLSMCWTMYPLGNSIPFLCEVHKCNVYEVWSIRFAVTAAEIMPTIKLVVVTFFILLSAESIIAALTNSLPSSLPGITSTQRRNRAARENLSYGMTAAKTIGPQGALYIAQKGLEGSVYAAQRSKQAAANKQYGKMFLHGAGTIARPVGGTIAAFASLVSTPFVALGGAMAAAGSAGKMGADAIGRIGRKDGKDDASREARHKVSRDKAEAHTEKVQRRLDKAVDLQMGLADRLSGGSRRRQGHTV
jgi:hypothetical protein